MDVQTYPKRFLPEPFEAYWVLTESYRVLLRATESYWVRVGIASGWFVHPWMIMFQSLREVQLWAHPNVEVLVLVLVVVLISISTSTSISISISISMNINSMCMCICRCISNWC